MTSVIEHISHPYASELWQARKDHAHITGEEFIERPWWFRNTEPILGIHYQFHDIYSCLGWPTEVTEKEVPRPGYAAVIGIVRPAGLAEQDHYDAKNAVFMLLDQVEEEDVTKLLDKCLTMRERYGYGIQPDLMKVWYGDPDRFLTTLALYNEQLGEDKAILITPPEDFYVPRIFDSYVRSLRDAINKKRFWFVGHNDLKNRIKEFTRDDPAVLAIGGLVHTLLGACLWMDRSQGTTIFTVDED